MRKISGCIGPELMTLLSLSRVNYPEQYEMPDTIRHLSGVPRDLGT